MSNVESQISMALQGLLAGQRGPQGGGQQAPDPRMLQQMMQMEQEQAMGLDKERARLEKETLRQEKQATLGVLLQDAMARQQAEEAFQRQIEMQNQMFEREKQLSNEANMFAAEQARFMLQNNMAESERAGEKAKEARNRQLALTAKLMAAESQLGQDQGFVANQFERALEGVSQIYKQRTDLNLKVESEILALNSSILGKSFGRRGLGKVLLGAGKEAGQRHQQTEAAAIYGQGMARLMLSTVPDFNPATPGSQGRITRLEQTVQNLLVDMADEGMSPDERIQQYTEHMAKIRTLAGPYGVAVLKKGLSEIVGVGAGAQTMEGDGTMRSPAFMNTSYGRMFQATNRMMNTNLAEDPMDLANPDEMFRGVLLTFGEILMAPDPATGEPITAEERRTKAINLAETAASKFAGAFNMDEERANELGGFLEAAFMSMLPMEEQIRSLDMLRFEAQSGEETAAAVEVAEGAKITSSRVLEFLNDFIKTAPGGSNASKGTGEAAAGPGSAVGANPAQP